MNFRTSRKRGKTELDKLNEDINEMFIRDDVLKANGKRKCAQKTVNYFKNDYIKENNKSVLSKKTSQMKKTTKNKKHVVETKPFINVKKLKRLQVIVVPLISVKNLKKPKKNPTGKKMARKPSEKRSIKLILSKKQNSNSKKSKDTSKLGRSKSTFFETSQTKRKSVFGTSNTSNKRKADSVFISAPEAKKAHIEEDNADVKIR